MRRGVLAVALAMLAGGAARADFKSFAHTYPHFTQPEGGLEVEWWVSAETQSLSNMGDTTLWEHRLEIEYGLTDRWDVSLYQVFQQPPGEGFTYDSVRLESRYQITRKQQWWVDLLGYLELERPADLHEPFELEGKIIAAKDLGPFFIQTNWIAEVKLAGGQQFGYVLELAAGFGYEILPSLRVGVETLWDLEKVSMAPGAASAKMIHVGPSVALARGRIWFVLTPDFLVAGSGNVPDRGQDLELRFITGINL
jgi:hypothetical protein